MRVVAFDRPGFGHTSRPPRSRWNGANPYTRGASVEIAVGLLDHLGIQRAVLAGASAGGTIAIEAGLAHPERCAGLVLISPAINGDVGPPGFLRPLLRLPGVRHLGARLVRRLGRGEPTLARIGRGWADPQRPTPRDLEAYAAPLRSPDWHRGLYAVVTAEAPPHLEPRLADLTPPTLVVAGDRDPVISPAASRRTADAIPRATFMSLPGCGHTPHEECPEALAGALLRFVQRRDV